MNLKKKFPLFVVLLLTMCTAFSCKDDDGVAGGVRFAAPRASDLTATTACIVCPVEGQPDAALLARAEFIYGPDEQDAAEFVRAACSVESGGVVSRLSGLRPATTYRGWFSLAEAGSVLRSEVLTFTTAAVAADTPVIEISGSATLRAAADGGNLSVAYEIANPSGGAISVEYEGPEWLHAFDAATEGVVTFAVEANEGAERTASFRMTYPGAEAVTITVVQAGDNTPSIEITGKKTIVAAAEGGVYSTTYEITNPAPAAKVQVAGNEAAWLHSFDTSSEGVVSFTVDANTGDERTALFELTYPDAQAVILTVRQEEGKQSPDPVGETITLTRNHDWPSSYQTTTARLGDHDYYLSNVAIYDENNGIQFKSSSGFIANKEDMGTISKVELVYGSRDGNKNFVLYVGDSEKPSSNVLEAETINGVYTFDCASFRPRYFKLLNGDGAGYLYEIKIYLGEGGTPAPDRKPEFTNLRSSSVTKREATLTCDFAYTGTATVGEAGFRYAAAGAAEQTASTSTSTGAKSASLTGLNPATTYTYYFYAVVGGELFRSSTATFTTQNEQGKPVPSGTYRSGWAELPANVDKAGDYYYAYHIRPDNRNMRNYSVCYSKELGCPVWVSAPMHNCYKGNSGRTDSYAQDPDLGCSQVGRRSGYTRGHMLGSSDRTVSRETNRQVFYYSNIGPQLQSGFNTGGGAWNNLESFVDGQWCADTLYQVIGCYWANKNKKVDGTVIPTHYYKVLLRTKRGNSGKWVVDCSADELKCAAFLVEHKSQAGLKPNRNMMIPVAELERMTGFTFFANVPNAPKSECNPSDWGL